MRLHVSILALAVLVAAGSGLAQSTSTAGQTVVVPSLPGLPNKEVKISGEELSNAEMVGAELSFTGQVIQWEEGRSITMKFEDGVTRVVPVASTIIFPPELRPGAPLTVLVRQTADGRYRVTGLRTGAPPPLPGITSATPSAAPAPTPAPAVMSAPPVVATAPPPPAPKGKTVVRASYLTVNATIKAMDKESLTVVQSNGRERTLKIAENAVVAEGLAPGDKVVLRVPLQKPFDGKTADRVERPKPKKAPPPSKFSQAESPKS